MIFWQNDFVMEMGCSVSDLVLKISCFMSNSDREMGRMIFCQNDFWASRFGLAIESLPAPEVPGYLLGLRALVWRSGRGRPRRCRASVARPADCIL